MYVEYNKQRDRSQESGSLTHPRAHPTAQFVIYSKLQVRQFDISNLKTIQLYFDRAIRPIELNKQILGYTVIITLRKNILKL